MIIRNTLCRGLMGRSILKNAINRPQIERYTRQATHGLGQSLRAKSRRTASEKSIVENLRTNDRLKFHPQHRKVAAGELSK